MFFLKKTQRSGLLWVFFKNPQQRGNVWIMMGQVSWLPMLGLGQQALQLQVEEFLERFGGASGLEERTCPGHIGTEVHITHHAKGLGLTLLIPADPKGLSKQGAPPIVDTVVRHW